MREVIIITDTDMPIPCVGYRGELIRCKDCIKKSLCMMHRETNDDYGYCSWAGRKEE